MRTTYFSALFGLLFILVSCEPKMEEFKADPGSADLSKYIALGSGMTAGFADGELYKSMQAFSLGNILATQFSQAGGGSFKQPLMLDDLGFGQRRVLGIATDCQGVSSLAPIAMPGTPNPGNFLPVGAQGPYQNMGVPGSKLLHILAPGLGVLNPYFGRFSSNPTTASIIGDASAQNPTFFSLWSVEDAIWFAKDGGYNVADSLTPVPQFTAYLNNILMAMMANGAKGVLANIPDIMSLPYFTTVPYNSLVLTEQAKVDLLNAAYGPYGLSFGLGANPWVIQDLTSPTGFRQIQAGEMLLLTLPQDSLKCGGWGTLKPIPHKYVLDAGEITATRNAISALNAVIAEAAQSKGLAYADVNLLLKQAEQGITFDAVTLTTRFVSGGLFSLDGLHLNAKGNAIVANLFIDAINARYGANVPRVVINDYPGVAFP